MRVMTYNILEGGNLDCGDRTELLLSVIRDYNPDILGLCECRGFASDNGSRFQRFKDSLEMSGTLSSSQSGNHLAILWKPSVSVSTADGSSVLMYNGYARVIVELPGFGSTSLILTHLHPYSGLCRLAELQTLIGRSRSTEHALIAGDLNTISRSDSTASVRDAPRHLVTRLLGPDGDFDTAPIDMLLSHGFVDLHAADPAWTYPTPLGGKQARYGCTVRLDYMFATHAIAASSSPVRTSLLERALHASDHLPIATDIHAEHSAVMRAEESA